MSPTPANSNLEKESSVLQKIKSFFTGLDLCFYTLYWLLVLLVVGTLAQRSMGLYLAQDKYFSSWLIWTPWMPVPGGRLAMFVLFVNLSARLLMASRWRWRSVGVNITHIGSLLLLVGGFLTANWSTEGSMSLYEKDKANFFLDDRAKELAILDTSPKNHDLAIAFSGDWLNDGEKLEHEKVPFSIEVIRVYDNCQVLTRRQEEQNFYKGFSKRFFLQSLPLDMEAYRNRMGMEVRLSGLDDNQNGIYFFVQGQETPQTFNAGGKTFIVEIRARRYPLDFSIELLDFEKEMHPGTGMARSYSSEVNLIIDGVPIRKKIEMNEPLRHQNYTFYQSSFYEGPRGEASVLSVVKNYGRTFPYISSIVICIGLLIHLMIKLPQLLVAQDEKKEEAHV